MKLKTIIPYIVVGIIGILLLNLIAWTYLSRTIGINRIDLEEAAMQHLAGTLFCFLFGLLIEWKIIIGLIKRERKLHFSPLLILGIIILAISCIPPEAVFMQFGLRSPFPISTRLQDFFIGPIAQSSKIQSILAVTSGCLITRGMTRNIVT